MSRQATMIPAGAELVINHISSSRPYFNPTPGRREEDYVCIFTIEVVPENLGYMYVNHFPSEVSEKEDGDKKKWLFEHMSNASFIKSHPLKC